MQVQSKFIGRLLEDTNATPKNECYAHEMGGTSQYSTLTRQTQTNKQPTARPVFPSNSIEFSCFPLVLVHVSMVHVSINQFFLSAFLFSFHYFCSSFSRLLDCLLSVAHSPSLSPLSLLSSLCLPAPAPAPAPGCSSLVTALSLCSKHTHTLSCPNVEVHAYAVLCTCTQGHECGPFAHPPPSPPFLPCHPGNALAQFQFKSGLSSLDP